MTPFSKFVKRNLRAGKTLYLVRAFPAKNDAHISVLRIASRPVFENIGTSKPSPRVLVWTDYGSKREHFLEDMHLYGNNKYNFHRVFTSKKKAQAYVDLVKQGTDLRSFFGYSQSVLDHYLSMQSPEAFDIFARDFGFDDMPNLDEYSDFPEELTA